MTFRAFRSRLLHACLCAAGFGQGCLDWSKLENGACGDDYVGREEACDDGNRISGDGCSDRCGIEPPFCGDGRVDAGEDCDDANDLNDDACVENCRQARCGDGSVWELEEQCDDGNTDAGDGCSAECVLEILEPGPRCGDGHLDGNEACDDADPSDANACLNGCSWATCGDGRLRAGVEECDDGNASSGCTRNCMQCGEAGSYFRGGNAHCYTVHPEPVTQQQARVTCQQEGGDLWTATSQMEGSDVAAKLTLDGRFWLGLQTSNTGRSWVTGEGTKFSNFAPGEPSDAALRCVVADSANAGAWSSQDCNAGLGFVCERAPTFFFPSDHHAYRLHTAALSALAAGQRCADDGGKLLALETDAERQFVGNAVGLATWVDASDSASDGNFTWPNGAAVDESLFAAGQPDDKDASQSCLLLNAGDRFADAKCGDAHAYVCEFD